jgi:hypothetical protein
MGPLAWGVVAGDVIGLQGRLPSRGAARPVPVYECEPVPGLREGERPMVGGHHPVNWRERPCPLPGRGRSFTGRGGPPATKRGLQAGFRGGIPGEWWGDHRQSGRIRFGGGKAGFLVNLLLMILDIAAASVRVDGEAVGTVLICPRKRRRLIMDGDLGVNPHTVVGIRRPVPALAFVGSILVCR